MKKLFISLVILLSPGFISATDNAAQSLLQAVSSNDLSTVSRILAAGADPNSKDDLELSVLWYASAKGNLAMVKLLLDRGADINAINFSGTTALWVASQFGHLAVVKELLSRGADPLIRDDHGNTALFWASTKGHKEIVELLKNAGAKETEQSYKRKPLNLQAEKFVKPSISIKQAVKILSVKGGDASEATAALYMYLNDPNAANRRDAIWALRPTSTFDSKKTIYDQRYILKLGDLLVDEDFGVQLAAASSLANLGKQAKLILDDLIFLITDAAMSVDLKVDITRGVGAIGPDAIAAVPSLIRQLNKGRPDLLMLATVSALGNIGPGARDAVPMLMDTLSRDEKTNAVRAAAAQALGKIGPDANKSVTSLISLVNNKDDNLRYQAIFALGRMGVYGKPAIPTLIIALHDPYKNAADMAADSLGKINVASDEVIDALIMAMDDGREVTTYARVLGELGAPARKAVPSLSRIMRGFNVNTGPAGIGRAHAIIALGKIGGKEAIDALKAMQFAPNRNVRKLVNEALAVAQSKAGNG